MATLLAENVTVGYRDRPVLHDVQLELDAGLHLLLGANGSGKTTLFRTLSGVLEPAVGRVLIDGRDPRHDLGAKARVGVSAHRAALAPRLSVLDNLRYWARILALPAAEREATVTHAVELLDLSGIAGQRAGTLSRGQAQRVSVARALVGDPPVLLLDEPFAAVDPGVAAQLREHLRSLATAGRTLVVSTHELADASRLGGDVTVLAGGRIVGHGPVESLRETLVGAGYQLRLRGTGNLDAALRGLGYEPCPADNEAVVVEVANDAAVESLVAGLVGAGVGVREVTTAGSPLEDVYLELQRESTADSPPARAGWRNAS